MDLSKNELGLILHLDEESFLRANIQKISAANYQLLLNVEHLKNASVFLSDNIESTLSIIQGSDGVDRLISGKIWSQNSSLSTPTAHHLTGDFEIRDNKIYFNDFSWGSLDGEGRVDLTYPYKVDFHLKLSALDINSFLDFWGGGRDFSSAGEVSGEIKISGAINQISLKGSLESYDGFVSELKYNSLYLHVEGTYPNLQIAHSTVSQADGMSFSFEGPFALNDPKNFKKQIEALTISPLVSNSAVASEWTIKRTKNENEQTSELKYFLRKDENVDSHLKEDQNLLGVMKTVEF